MGTSRGDPVRLTVVRQWRAGDMIDLMLPAGLRLEQAMDDA